MQPGGSPTLDSSAYASRVLACQHNRFFRQLCNTFLKYLRSCIVRGGRPRKGYPRYVDKAHLFEHVGCVLIHPSRIGSTVVSASRSTNSCKATAIQPMNGLSRES